MKKLKKIIYVLVFSLVGLTIFIQCEGASKIVSPNIGTAVGGQTSTGSGSAS